MVRLFREVDESIHGKLEIDQVARGVVEVYYVPPPLLLAEFDIDPDDAELYKAKLIEIDTRSGKLTIFPLNTNRTKHGLLGPKYTQVRRITLADGTPVLSIAAQDGDSSIHYARSVTFHSTEPLEVEVASEDIADSPWSADQIKEILESLPPTFTKDYDFGLGLAKPYRFIVEAVEELTDCDEILISAQEETGVDEAGSVFRIASADFEALRKTLNSTTRLGQVAGMTVKSAQTYNFFARLLGQPLVPINLGRQPLRKLLTRAAQGDEANLSEEEQEEVIGFFSRNLKSISESSPEKLVRLKNDLEFVNLEKLIARYEDMLAKGHNEAAWQEFLERNPFVLSLVFSYPIVKVGQQASVGGRKLSGKGEKITDFLLKNSKTNNTALVEIKTPRTKLLNKREFRGGVFTPSKELSGSIVQALDQKYQFERDISGIKDRSKEPEVESYSVHCCLIVGTMLEDDDEKKSFELYRRNSKDVEIVTFDELLEKMIELRGFLASSGNEDEAVSHDAEVPF